jgi:hypothetical protein
VFDPHPKPAQPIFNLKSAIYVCLLTSAFS